MSPHNRGSVFAAHLARIVAELRAAGWDVLVMEHDAAKSSDEFVDFFAQRGDETLIGVLASRRTAQSEWFKQIPRLTQELPNTRVQVYWLGDVPEASPDVGDVQVLLAEARDVYERSRRGGFLLAWAGLEGAISIFSSRLILQSERAPARPREMLTALRSLGHLDEQDFTRLSSLWRLRNTIAHQATPIEPSLGDFQFVVDAAHRMAAGLYISADSLVEWFLKRYQQAVEQPFAKEGRLHEIEQVLGRAFPHAPSHILSEAVAALRSMSDMWVPRTPEG